MKTLYSLFLVLVFTLSTHAQVGEFKTYSNGLIYNEKTMEKLGHIVDSLNLKFKTCDANKKCYSKLQTHGTVVRLTSEKADAACDDMTKQISLDDFLKKYPDAIIEKDVLILKSKYTTYQNQKMIEIEEFDFKSDYGLSISSDDLTLYERDLQNKWLFEYNEKSEYSKESVSAFFFNEKFESKELPQKYSLMIGYADCLIDTSTAKFKEDLKSGDVDLPKNWMKLSDKEKKKLLDEMRSTQVTGFCSMDSRPREHAVNIALLAAETSSWEVFLKAHLDVMNDRFDRMSDGSYAQEERQTYIKELEELDINVSDLVLGISFRIHNPAKNHYYGSISRVGRALSETKNNKEIESNMLAIICDPKLDDYNRALFYFLFLNYNHHIKDETIKKANAEKLAIAESSLPSYMKDKLKKE